MTRITALIITLNEEGHIGAAIDSLAGVADEVIVMDSFSTDRTREIAISKGAKVIEQDFHGFGEQKNIGAALAANDYILSIDADEVLSDTLRASLLKLKTNLTEGVYYVHRLNHIGSTAIKSCGWYPDTRIRLYHRMRAKWDNKQVHEELHVHEKVLFLEGDLLHYSYDGFEDMKRRSDRYAKLAAGGLKGSNPIALVFKMLVNPIAKFIKAYLMQQGFSDGYTGWMISRYRARETFYKYYLALR